MRFAIALILCLAAAPAFAASPTPSAPQEGAPGTNVEMPFLMAPMTGSDGKLSGYAYISTRLTATSPTVALDVRDRIAFIQDAFVRDVNGSSVAESGDPGTVDNQVLAARLLADARKVMGPGKVASIAIVQLQIAPLRPNPAMTQVPNAPPPDAPPPSKLAKAP